MSWKPEVFVQGKWYRNGLTFATRDEADRNARDLCMRWTLCEGSRAVEVDDRDFPVNYRYEGGRSIPLEAAS